MTDFNMALDKYWEFEILEDEGRLVISAESGQTGCELTEEQEIKLAKHLYNKHLKDIKPENRRLFVLSSDTSENFEESAKSFNESVREALKDYDPLEADNE